MAIRRRHSGSSLDNAHCDHGALAVVSAASRGAYRRCCCCFLYKASAGFFNQNIPDRGPTIHQGSRNRRVRILDYSRFDEITYGGIRNTEPDAFFLDIFFNALPIQPTAGNQAKNVLVPSRLTYTGGQMEFGVELGPEVYFPYSKTNKEF